jgi:hypothetical protein
MEQNPYESPREIKKKGNSLTLGDVGFFAVAIISSIVVASLFWGLLVLLHRARI